jgi:hypothetical protein
VLPLAIGAGVYLLLLFAGNRLLGDPDTQWQITIGQWILTHRMVPESDIYSFHGRPVLDLDAMAGARCTTPYR